MGNSASIILPFRSGKFFPAFEFQGQGDVDPALSFDFSSRVSPSVGPGKIITLPSNVAAAAAKLLADNQRVVMKAVLSGVPNLRVFNDTEHTFLYEHYRELVHGPDGWAQDPVGYLVEILGVNSNVAQLRSSLPFEFGQRPFSLKLIPGSQFVTGASLTDLFLSRPPLSSSDVQIVQAKSCKKDDSTQCKLIHDAFDNMAIGAADMVKLTYALDVNIARNDFTGIVRSAALFDNTLHSCFNDNIVTDAHIFADTGAGQGDGIILNGYSSYNSVVTNSFSKLRHAMLLQYGANSNVIANNRNDNVRCQICRPSPWTPDKASDMRKTLQSNVILKPLVSRYSLDQTFNTIVFHSVTLDSGHSAVNTACINTQFENNPSKEFNFLGNNLDWCADVSFHGFFSNNNLIEGNVVDSIKIADYYGPSPSNVVYGNLVKAPTLGILVDRASTDTVLIDNLFLKGGFTFLDDASSTVCLNNKQCVTPTSCQKLQPEFHDIDIFETPCANFNSGPLQVALKAFASTKLGKFLGINSLVDSVKEACEFANHILGGRGNRDACARLNVQSSSAPASFFTTKSLKMCSLMSTQCFVNVGRVVVKKTCVKSSESVLSPASARSSNQNDVDEDDRAGDDNSNDDDDAGDDGDADVEALIEDPPVNFS
jgi:hypothetical protein